MPNTALKFAARLFALTIVAFGGACSEPSTSPTERQVRAVRAEFSQAAGELGRAVATWLRDPEARASLLRALETSEFRESKVSWRAFVRGLGSALLTRLVQGSELFAEQRILNRFGDLEVYFPVPEHRATWSGDTNLFVTVFLGDDKRPLEGWLGHDLNGDPVALSIDAPPATPVLVVHRPEGFRLALPLLQRAECYEDCGGGGGGGGGGGSLPSGFFMVDWQIDQSYEGWTAGSPEFEFVAWHWTGQWIYNDYGGRVPVVADDFMSCTSGDYLSTDPRDWYYNSPPEKHYAWEYGSSGIQVLNADEAIAFPQGEGPILMITENDDTPCIEGEFPTAWDPYFPENNDEFVGSTSGASLVTASSVPFYGDEYNPGLHASISFVRR